MLPSTAVPPEVGSAGAAGAGDSAGRSQAMPSAQLTRTSAQLTARRRMIGDSFMVTPHPQVPGGPGASRRGGI